MKRLKETLILSFALFAMFFGASNVILPSYIGLRVANHLPLAAIGFVLSGVGLPLLGLLVVVKNKGDYLSLFSPMGKWFSKIFLVLAFLSIGPIIAIPRTAATTFEIGILPLFHNANPYIISFIFFTICVLFCINETKVITEIAKILTPLLLIGLIILIIGGILNKNVTSYPLVEKNAFVFSFLQGYNTLDAIASIIFARIIYNSVKDNEDSMQISKRASIIAALGLAVVYIGIMYLGNTVKIENALSYDRTTHIVKITELLLGSVAKITMAVIISFACLTTAVGLIASVSEFFEKIFKIKYEVLVIIIAFISFLISHLKVNRIINLTIPILLVFYPVLICIIILNILKNKYINDVVIRNATYTSLVISVMEQFNLKIISFIPLSSEKISWLIPTIMVSIITIIYQIMKSGKDGK